MKRLIFVFLVSFCVHSITFSQEKEVDKNATNEILPQVGDFGLSIDASPVLTYLGKCFSDEGADGSNLFQNVQLFGMYILKDDVTLRLGLNMAFPNQTQDSYEPKTFPRDQMVKNSISESSSLLELSFGYAFTRGYKRLQAFYGPEIALGFQQSSSSYEWGNELVNSIYMNPTTRPLEYESGTNFYTVLGGFVGVEYYFAPRMSVSGEFGLRCSFFSAGEGTTKIEYWDTDTLTAKEKEYKTGGGKGFNFETVTRGNLAVNFYF